MTNPIPERASTGQVPAEPTAAHHEQTDPNDHLVHYEVRVRGHLDAHWAERFDGLTLTHEGDGTSALVGPLADQATLYGLLDRLRNLGLSLVSVNPLHFPRQRNGGDGHGANPPIQSESRY